MGHKGASRRITVRPYRAERDPYHVPDHHDFSGKSWREFFAADVNEASMMKEGR